MHEDCAKGNAEFCIGMPLAAQGDMTKTPLALATLVCGLATSAWSESTVREPHSAAIVAVSV